MSTNCSKLLTKVTALTDNSSDFVLLSDTRLGSNETNRKNLHDMFLLGSNKSYTMHSNSTKNSRGTAILESSKTPFKVTNTLSDRSKISYSYR